GKIQFSLSGPDARNKALQIKKDLKSEDKSVRYIEPKNTATILHNNLIERETDFLMEDGSVFVTRAIQPFEEFTERDFSRPRPDKLSGMLPPKLARILINLSEAKIDDQILDPFCGSGTILAEAAHMGYKKLIGSDLSSKAIKDTENNLEWLKNSSKISKLNYKLYFSDVNTLADKIDKKTINTIITEPYMGRPLKGTERKIDLVSQTRELKDLYLGAFKTFDKVLKKNSTIIFIIPRFKFQDSWVTIDCKDDIKKLGFKIEPFSPENDFLLYHRPQQHVGREIWKFRQA
ncbi:RsmD family RNA methyltransferase, partial [Patescibacteria group bacterium]|nr:RsmD family RNA methyltransferase [Patescibacteria group bacterium]